MAEVMTSPVIRRLDLRVLDLLRGLAAVYVLLGHARQLLWSPAAGIWAAQGHDLPPRSGFARLLGAATGALSYGETAVLLFFIISGFCIHFRQAAFKVAEHRQADLNLRAYSWRRIRRLWPPLAFALLLTAVCDLAGSTLSPSLYSGRSGHAALDAVQQGGDHYATETLVGNLFMQGSLAVPQFGTNAPLWSLALEVWFYALYPLLLPVSTHWGARGLLVVGGAVSAGAFLLRVILHVDVPDFVSASAPIWILRILAYWIVWCTGAAIAEVYVGRAPVRWLRLLVLPALGCIALALVGAKASGPDAVLSGPGGAYLGAFGLATLLAWALLTPPAPLCAAAEWAADRGRFLGDLSYTLYLTHYPWLALVCAWWLSTHDDLPSGAELAVAGTVTAGVVALGAWYLVERHFVSGRMAAGPKTVDRHRASLNPGRGRLRGGPVVPE